MKLIENAEIILNADKIDSGKIGIVGGKKKNKPLQDQMDEVSSNQEIDHPGSSLLKETSKQYYDLLEICRSSSK